MKHGETAKRLRSALERKGMKQTELASRTGLSKASISQYLSGLYVPSNISAGKMADVLGVSPAWLMGFDINLPLGIKKIPLLGSIACGEPVLMAEERGLYVNTGAEINADFALIAKGDSMTGARICDGDIVFIRSQPTVENGEIAAVAVDDECLLKKFYRENDVISLVSANPNYAPKVYTPASGKTVRVLGKAVAFQSDLE